MGSSSDWETMQGAADTLTALGVAHEVKVVSAHRTPDLLFEYAASARERGLKAIIAGAGGAARSFVKSGCPAVRNVASAAEAGPASATTRIATVRHPILRISERCLATQNCR